jgi:hypothetical protein
LREQAGQHVVLDVRLRRECLVGEFPALFPASENLNRRGFDFLPQEGVKPAPRNHVRLRAQNFGREFLDVHEFVKTDGAQIMVEEKIDIGSAACFAAGG